MPESAKPKAILFDAVGTLIYPQPAVPDAYCRLAARHGYVRERSEVVERFRAAYARHFCTEQTSEAMEAERWRAVVQEVFASSGPRGEALFADLWTHFADSGHWRVYDDVAAAWQQLETAGYTIGVASNFDARLRGLCRRLPPLDRAAHVFVSSAAGFSKPRREFFRAVEDKLKAAPAELLLVGDDPRRDYDAARQAGWQAVLIAREAPRPPHAIRSLHELPAQLRLRD